jgi:hypothetical protein
MIKRSTSLAAAVAAAALLAGSPLLASPADQQTGPIRIDNTVLNRDLGEATEFAPGYAQVAFTNQNGVPATNVVFALTSNGHVVGNVEDDGSFAPGVTIRYDFQDHCSADDQQLAVQSVTFADGTVWNNPDINAALGF